METKKTATSEEAKKAAETAPIDTLPGDTNSTVSIKKRRPAE